MRDLGDGESHKKEKEHKRVTFFALEAGKRAEILLKKNQVSNSSRPNLKHQLVLFHRSKYTNIRLYSVMNQNLLLYFEISKMTDSLVLSN